MRYDYIIVGGGSAGCVLANRLSAGGEHSVCLLEAGPKDTSPFILMPGGIIPLMRFARHNWQFWTATQKNLHNRQLYWPRGKTLGGSSSINAMCYIRGNAWDYDHWASLGNDGWSYRDVLPYFRKSENYECGSEAAGAPAPDQTEFHGKGGPLNICARRHTNKLSEVFLEAAQQAGYKLTADFNGAQQEGLGHYRVFQKDGQRCSNARAYLRPVEGRPNLSVITGAHVTRVLFDGKRAVGVRYFEAGRYVDLLASREVILASGAIGSPHLLLLSGVGPRAELERHGIAVTHELPGVGQNLQDHLDIVVSVRSKNRLPMSFHPMSLLRGLVHFLKYLFGRGGELTSNAAETGGFIKSRPEEPIPDIQWHFVPFANAHHGLDLTKIFRTYAFTGMACDLRPLSRGTVTLESGDPLAPPRIDPNYAAHERDLDKLVIGVKKLREVFAQKAFDAHRAEELEPGPQVRTDEEIREWIRGHSETIYHPVGTCKMGSDALAVVDARLRVHGIAGLRVIDASIMPTLVGGNTNAPTTMIAEKGADMILEDAAGSAGGIAAKSPVRRGVPRAAVAASLLAAGLAALLAACSFAPAKIFSDYVSIEVREVGRSLHCNAAGPDGAAQLFTEPASLRRWLDARAMRLQAAESLADVPHAVVEMGQRPSGGYGVAVSRAAVLRGELLILSATFVSPGPGAMVTQALTSPCAVVQLPPGRYSSVEVQDQAGKVRATGAVYDGAAS